MSAEWMTDGLKWGRDTPTLLSPLFLLQCWLHTDESQLLAAAGVTSYQPSPPSACMCLQVCGSKSLYPWCLCHSKRPGTQKPSTHPRLLAPHKLLLFDSLGAPHPQALVNSQDQSEHQSTNKWGQGWGSTWWPAKPQTNVRDYCIVLQKEIQILWGLWLFEFWQTGVDCVIKWVFGECLHTCVFSDKTHRQKPTWPNGTNKDSFRPCKTNIGKLTRSPGFVFFNMLFKKILFIYF